MRGDRDTLHKTDLYHYENKENSHLRMNYEQSKADRKFTYPTQNTKKTAVARTSDEKL